MNLLFAHAGEVVLGRRARTPRARFASALSRVERQHQGTLVVAHGTVMSLYTAAANASDAGAIWARLGLPSLMVFERQSHRLVR
jgi:broad specificity phosphatase PhoE